jgi:hypothetical protein
MTTGWHVDDAALRRWIGRADSLAEGASVEQHLLSCAPCRARVNAAVARGPAGGVPVAGGRAVDLDAVWARTRDAIELPRPSAFERLLRRVGVPANEARLIAAASSFSAVWLAGVAAVLTFATLAAVFGPSSHGAALFLSVAPLVPCLAVAFSYAPEADPALEPEGVAPYPALRLVLLRTIAVLALALPTVVLVGLFIPGLAPYLWLLPAVGFVAAVLALSTWISPARAAIAVSAAWLGLLWLLVARSGSADAALRAESQLFYLALIAASFVVVLVRGRRPRERRIRL